MGSGPSCVSKSPRKKKGRNRMNQTRFQQAQPTTMPVNEEPEIPEIQSQSETSDEEDLQFEECGKARILTFLEYIALPSEFTGTTLENTVLAIMQLFYKN
ncbi:hypothetical protein DMENIID0001_132680 [Sergentomyia squamirostris]